MHDLLSDFLNVTEKAAIKTLPWVGKGNKNAADQAATTSMRENLNQMEMNGVIVIGEGEIDEAPMLFIDEKVGNGHGLELDIAVDPIDGTTATAAGEKHSIAVIAAAPKGSLLHAPDMYMEKIAVGPEAVGKIKIEAPLIDNLNAVAKAKNKQLHEMHVLVQDRPRHHQAIQQMRDAGVKVNLFKDGDILQSLLPCIRSDEIDMLYNIGGAPEGVLAAVAIKCLGGEMQARLSFRKNEEYERCLKMGMSDPKTPLRHHQLVGSEQGLFIATAITDTVLLKGIQQESTKIKTQSLVINHTNNHYQIVENIHR